MTSLAQTLAEQVARQQEEIDTLRTRLEKVDPRPAQNAAPNAGEVDKHLRRALKLMDNDPDRAAALFLAWCDQDSEMRKVLKAIITEALDRRLHLFAQEATELADKAAAS